MDYSNLTPEQKVMTLEETVLTKSAAQTDEYYKAVGEIEFTAHALLYACRFRGLEHVKALVENGATFDVDFTLNAKKGRKYPLYHWEYSAAVLKLPIDRLKGAYRVQFGDWIIPSGSAAGKRIEVLPFEERAKIVSYLLENREKSSFDAAKVLMYAIFMREDDMYDVLKEHGVTFSEEIIETITEGKNTDLWNEYTSLLSNMSKKNFFPIHEKIIAEIGSERKLHFVPSFLYWDYFYKPTYFTFYLENYNQKKMNKMQIMRDIVLREDMGLMAAAESYGWLKQPKKRDELIEYASKMNKTESTAWLLDFKNRTADLEKESIQREKRLQSALNASPDSISELKKIWSCKKQEDGTTVITGYKGRQTKVVVPDKIGKSPVTAIDSYAFSPQAPRVGANPNKEPAVTRKAITEVVLPKGLKEIRTCAFFNCVNLETVDIPEGVEVLEDKVFLGCKKLKKADIPSSVKKIGVSLFVGCEALESAVVPEGITELENCFFTNCSSLKNVTLPSSLKIIKNNAFEACHSLEEIIIPEGVEEMGTMIFMNCKSLKKVELPLSVKKIKNRSVSGRTPWTIFDYTPDELVVTVYKGSYAEKYCKRNNINYEYIPNPEGKE